MNYLAFDCETSGTNPKEHMLLTIYFGVYNSDFELIDELDMYLKPDTENHGEKVEEKALEITGIDVQSHLANPDTITYTQGAAKLSELLEKHKIKGKRIHYRPIGQNIEFDLKFVYEKLMSQELWEKKVHYKYLDTLRIVTFLQDVGILASDIGNLSSLVEYFNIPMGQAHNAKEDVRMTVDVYKALKSMLNEKKDNFSGVSNNSLLEIIER